MHENKALEVVNLQGFIIYVSVFLLALQKSFAFEVGSSCMAAVLQACMYFTSLQMEI